MNTDPFAERNESGVAVGCAIPVLIGHRWFPIVEVCQVHHLLLGFLHVISLPVDAVWLCCIPLHSIAKVLLLFLNR